jgi:electron transport complex protein RnfB
MSAGAADLDVQSIDALLPQTQCTRCGFPGCLPYAEAIASGAADINQCPPGGSAAIQQIARLLHRQVLELNPANGVHAPPRVAWIDASRCIGCAKCLPPCPVDAILGASKFIHTVITDRCTGCELCVAPCPVDCIEMRPSPPAAAPIEPSANRRRYEAHVARDRRRRDERDRELQRKKSALFESARSS